MGAESVDELSGIQHLEFGELGRRVTNHEDALGGDCVHTTKCSTLSKETKNGQTDGSGFKRAWQVDDEQTSVQIIYKLLSRKSKKKLEELLHQWSEWHAQQCSLSENFDEDLECGEETYFPALNASPSKSCTISFYMDNSMKKKQRTEDSSFDKGSVPIYDRDYAFALTSGDGLSNNESDLRILNASRCFNCDAYDHSLNECPKPFNKVAVSNARKLHQSKSKRPAGSRVLTRYYQDTPGGKFDGLKPGCLDPETRKLLGLGEFHPPPWLNRMREMGYPPGYLDLEDDDQPSGIVIYAHEDTKEENAECLDVNPIEPKRKMSVDFPGINAPIPVNADLTLWATPNSQPTGNTNNNKLLNHQKVLQSRDHSLDPSRWRDHRRESSPFMSEYAHNNQSYPPAFPLLSNYANEYWHHMNQPSPHYSAYMYQNSWSSFHG